MCSCTCMLWVLCSSCSLVPGRNGVEEYSPRLRPRWVYFSSALPFGVSWFHVILCVCVINICPLRCVSKNVPLGILSISLPNISDAIKVWCYIHKSLWFKLSSECARERIVKIGEHLAKIGTKGQVGRFFETQCRYYFWLSTPILVFWLSANLCLVASSQW